MNEHEHSSSAAQTMAHPEFEFLTSDDCDEFLAAYDETLAKDYYDEARLLFLSGEFTTDEKGWQQILEIAWPRAKANNAIYKKMIQRNAERSGAALEADDGVQSAQLGGIPLANPWLPAMSASAWQ